MRTFTNFDVGTVYFRHMGVQVSRICTIFYGESVLEIFASFDLERSGNFLLPPATAKITKVGPSCISDGLTRTQEIA